MYPLLLYMQIVLVHTPTPTMYFYGCDSWGSVKNFAGAGDYFEYEVAFKCKGSRIRTDWIPQENLRETKKK